ncbi:hypothetical protein AOQ84DRAFT_444016 [Glonium stellatum]|uniref:ferric-chelate reductase (NADPH) n=1 Tax=Glonium stellatum TaxID=574774 RepID=A0A8E2EMG0_9PEZI|nr:hypothetical protein AOQ84DRAFT_444016 [Glonium stellatum]
MDSSAVQICEHYQSALEADGPELVPFLIDLLTSPVSGSRHGAKTFRSGYGKWMTYFYAFWIFLFTAIHFYHILKDNLSKSNTHDRSRKPSWNNKIIALCRSFTYRRLGGPIGRAIGLRQTSFGTLSLLSLATIFSAILPFPEHPYLRSLFRFGSPPLSVRCALIISSLTPLIVALAGKVNVITFLTGICYSKLNILHRYCAYVLFCLATVHSVPHIISPVRDGGWGMLDQLYKDKRRELSGTLLYGVCSGLVCLSIPWIRRRAYEFFAYTHVILAIAYVALLFWHIYGEYMSPNYLYSAIAVWAFSAIVRLFHRTQLFRPARTCANLTGFPTKLTHLPGKMTRVTVTVPDAMTWRPGQHAYIRMPQISVLGNHPFTIASVPVSREAREAGQQNELVFLVRAHTGFTHTLAHMVEQTSTTPPASGPGTPTALHASPVLPDSPTTTAITTTTTAAMAALELLDLEKAAVAVSEHLDRSATPPPPPPQSLPPRARVAALRTLIDGPYGGHMRPLHRLYDTVLCVAGGSGISAVLPWVLALSRRMLAPGAEPVATTRLHLVWVVREAEWIEWVRPELEEVVRGARETMAVRVQVEVFVTAKRSLNFSYPYLRPYVPLPELVLPVLPSPVWKGSERAFEMKREDSGWSAETRIGKAEVEMGVEISEKIKNNFGSGIVNVRYERPVLSKVVERSIDGDRTIVLGCGPEEMKVDLSNTVARMQRRVLKGEMCEVALHTETFGW